MRKVRKMLPAQKTARKNPLGGVVYSTVSQTRISIFNHMVKRYDLEDRLIRFACTCIYVAEKLPDNKGGQVLEHQLVRSATSSALNYGEAQAAESKADFLHKIRLTLKEIRESRVALKIILTKPYLANEVVDNAFAESNELMAIFIQSIKTSTTKAIKP